ncbi:MAG: AAA family ATPase, partial [Nevskiaceae bacterium]
CIGSTTYQEYRGVFEKDRALARRFQKIDVGEPSVEDTVKILEGLKTRFEEHHAIQFTSGAIRSAVELAVRHITDRQLPDKAIDVIDEAAARLRLLPESKRRKTVQVRDIEETVAKIARIPPKAVSTNDRDKLATLERDLKLTIFGQDHAIEQLASSIKLARSGLGNADKPIGAFLLAGPTGVGKTEVTKQLAQLLGIELVRFDMSEYMERHTVSRLIGAPPGYVGFDQGGLLTDAVLKQPHSVVLLDEIEKAHPDVFNLLLQVMDHGTLTDNNGRHVDFRNVILVMTTNMGAFDAARNSIGFVEQNHAPDALEAIKKGFTPEFRNRLDAVIPFAALGQAQILRVVEKFLIQLEAQLGAKGVVLEVDEAAKLWLAERGYDPKMGARPMARVIQDQIKRPLAEELLFGKLQHGGSVTVRLADSGLRFDITGREKAPTLEPV